RRDRFGRDRARALSRSGTLPPKRCAHRQSRPQLVEKLEIALHDQQRRSILHFAEQPRVKPLPEREPFSTELFHLRNFALGVLAAPERRYFAAPASREVRHGGKRRAGCSKAGDELA